MTLFWRDLGAMDYGACRSLQQTLFDRLLARKRSAATAGIAPFEAADAAPSGHALRMESPATDDDTRTPHDTGREEADRDDAGTILFVEHPPVYTLGKSGRVENLLVGLPELERSGAQFFHIDRGGDITYHGPGQLVCYPILDLERLGIGLRAYIEALEEAVIRTVAHYGIRGERIAGASGVWITGSAVRTAGTFAATEPGTGTDASPAAGRGANAGDDAGNDAGDSAENVAENVAEDVVENVARDVSGGDAVNVAGDVARDVVGDVAENDSRPRKICAIGVRSSRYITMHGFALNVTTDLRRFALINPCGFTDRGATSIAVETGHEVPLTEVRDLLVEHLKEILNVKIYKY